MTRPIEALISRANVQNNLTLARRLAPGASVMAVVKANAYGHGAIQIAHALSGDGDEGNSAADAFGVASLEEAIELRAAGIRHPIVLLSGVFATAEMQEVASYGFAMVIHCAEQLAIFLEAKLSRPIDIWLKCDSGMHRLGFDGAGFQRAAELLRESEQADGLVFMSHLACADEPSVALNNQQLVRFSQQIAAVGPRPHEGLSLANSAALMTRADMHFDWVRPGVMLYGINPFNLADMDSKSAEKVASMLRPVMTLRSRIIAIREVPLGDSVGYGEAWRAEQRSRIAIVAAGYGDGYPRHAKNGTPVLINGQLAALAGRVSMDLLSIDITHLPGVKVGDPVTLWGESLAIETIAQWSGTIAYELLTGVNQRVKFTYL